MPDDHDEHHVDDVDDVDDVDHPAGEHHLDEHDVFYDLDDAARFDDLLDDVGAALLDQLVDHHAAGDDHSGPDYGYA